MAKLANLARMTTATSGTGTMTLGSAVAGYLTFAQSGVANGQIVSYGIRDGNSSEVGYGTYSSSGPTLTRSVTNSTNSNAAISLSGSAEVFVTPRVDEFGSIFYVESYGAVGDGTTDNTAAVQSCINAAVAAGGGLVLFGPGVFRINSQIAINGSGITVMGAGKSGGFEFKGTTLLLYASAHKFLIGGSSQTRGYRFTNFHIVEPNNVSYYMFETRSVRGISWDNITFINIFGFAKLGRSGEATNFAYFGDGFEGNMNSTSYEHFIDAVQVDGPLMLSGNSHIEGNYTTPTGSTFINFQHRIDGMQMSGWCVRLFKYGINFGSVGCANAYITNVTFDGFDGAGIYSATEAVNGLMITNCHFAGIGSDPITATSIGIRLNSVSSGGSRIVIANNNIFNQGDEGIQITGVDADVTITGNTINGVGQRLNNNSSGIYLGGSPRGNCSNNTIISTSTNKTSYGVNNQSTSPQMLVANNVSVGHVTGASLGPKIGELREATSTTAGISSSTPTNIVSLSLPPGDWDVWGTIVTDPAGTTTTSFVNATIGTASATVGSHPNAGADVQFTASVPAGNRVVMPTGTRRIQITTTTTVYLVGFVIFAVSTMNAYGYIGARRVCQQ